MTAAVLIAAAAFVGAGPSHAASGYQYGCSPWRLSGYDFRQFVSGWGYHSGQDIGCRAGTPVYAIADGTVKYSALTPDSWRWGNLIMIEHDDGSRAVGLYGHLGNDRRVSAGQRVGKGQRIGTIGPGHTRENGRWGAHLHFSITPGSYGTATGSYWSLINGYERGGEINRYTHPTRYIQNRQVRQPTYNYSHISQTGATVQGKSSEYWVEFRLRNTGTATWSKGGANPVRLGTDRPRDHRTAFSAGMGGHGWLNPSRIEMQSDTAPGQTAVFRARFNNKGVKPGTYHKYFRPVVEGVGWMRDTGMHAKVTVRLPRYGAQGYRVTAHDDLSPVSLTRTDTHRYLAGGTLVNLKAYIKNTGDFAWNAGGKHPVRLGTEHRRDRRSGFAVKSGGRVPGSEGWLAGNRASKLDGIYIPSESRITPASAVKPGQIGVFSFTVKSPSKSGEYREHFRPVIEGDRWLDANLHFGLRVLPKGNHYAWVKQDDPDPISLGGDTETARVYIRNSGQSSWKVGGPLRLGTDRKRDRSSAFRGPDWISASRASTIDAVADAPAEDVVDPGQIARFDFQVKSASKPDGSYREYFRPVIDGKEWLRESDKYVPVTVRSGDYDYGVVSQRYSQNPADLGYGDTVTATVRIRNHGHVPWPVDGPSPVRLGTSGPQDRSSAFAALTGADAWFSPTRASGIDGRVDGDSLDTGAAEIKQGEIAQFNVPMQVSSEVEGGARTERFNLVREGEAWFPDRGISVPLNVTAQTYDYRVVGQSASRNLSDLRTGDTAVVQLAVKNTGRYAWPVSGVNRVRLGTARPTDRSSSFATLAGEDPWLSANRASGIDGRVLNVTTFDSTPATEILPGETALFNFTVTASTVGHFNEYFRLVQENRAWFPDHSLVVSGSVVGSPQASD
jgi:hypothetical protein